MSQLEMPTPNDVALAVDQLIASGHSPSRIVMHPETCHAIFYRNSPPFMVVTYVRTDSPPIPILVDPGCPPYRFYIQTDTKEASQDVRPQTDSLD